MTIKFVSKTTAKQIAENAHNFTLSFCFKNGQWKQGKTFEIVYVDSEELFIGQAFSLKIHSSALCGVWNIY